MKERTYIVRNNDQRDEFIEKLRQWDVKKPLAFTIQAYHKKRSTAQNSLIHGLMRQLSDALYFSGQSKTKLAPEALKLDCRQRFLGEVSTIVLGKVVSETRHTSDLTPGECVRFVDDIVHYYGSTYGVQLVVGEEYYELKAKQRSTRGYPIVECPNCETPQEDCDGLGVIHCEVCGYCTHPALDGDVCEICGATVKTEEIPSVRSITN
jgi:hypothetical protein